MQPMLALKHHYHTGQRWESQVVLQPVRTSPGGSATSAHIATGIDGWQWSTPKATAGAAHNIQVATCAGITPWPLLPPRLQHCDYVKNSCTPDDRTAFSNSRAHWHCHVCAHDWNAGNRMVA